MRKIQLMKPWFTEVERQAVLDVMDSGWVSEGEKVVEFEEAIAKYVGVKHAIAVPNATLGLVSSISSMRNDCIAVPSFTHPATALACCNHPTILFDVNEVTGCIDTEIVDCISDFAYRYNITTVVPVSWGGVPLSPIVYSKLRDHGFQIVEDAACSIGAKHWDGKQTGSYADITVFSFHPRKLVCSGEGGMVVTNSDVYADDIRCVKNFGRVRDEFAVRHGLNLKMSDINAAIGLVQLSRIDDILSMRRDVAHRYNQLLVDIPGVCLPCSDLLEGQTYQSYCIRVPANIRDRLIRHMLRLGIETQIGTYSLHEQSAFDRYPRIGDLRVSEELYRSVLTLPVHHELSPDDQEYIAGVIDNYMKRSVDTLD